VRLCVLIGLLGLLGCTGSADRAGAELIELPVITTGEMIDLAPYLEEGRVTVFDFYADWCPPCVKLDQSLLDMQKLYGDRLAVYKLDLVSWDSELARGFGIKDLPYLIVYGRDKRQRYSGQANLFMTDLVKILNESGS